MNLPRKRLGQILRLKGKLSGTQLIRALDQQKIRGQKLGQILVEEEIISPEDLLLALHEQLQIPIVDFGRVQISREALALLPQQYAMEHMVLPLLFLRVAEGLILVVAMADPTQKAIIHDLHRRTGFSIKPLLASNTDLILAIGNAYRDFHKESAIAL